MSRGHRIIRWTAAAAAFFLLVPLVAGAAAPRPPWVGVYSGGGTARSMGESRGAHVTVFATQDGDEVRFLIQVAGYSIEARGKPSQSDPDMIVVPIRIEGGDIQGTGEAVLERVKGRWQLSATGEGSAYGLAGEGGLLAKRAVTRMPTVSEQLGGTVRASLGSTDTAHVPPPAEGPVTPLTPPEPSAPADTRITAGTLALAIVLAFLQALGA